MVRLTLASVVAVCAASAAWVACSNSSTTSPSDAGPVSDTGQPTIDTGAPDSAPQGLTLALACSDSIDSVYGDPGTLPADKGDIIKCAHDRDLTVSDITTTLQADTSQDYPPATNLGYTGKPLTSGAHIYRVSYRTERGDTNNTPGYTSAELLIPDTPRAASLPIMVASHGSRGQGASCTASLETDAGWDVNGDYVALSLSLVGFGYAVLMPDLPGYANYGAPNNPASAYASAADVGKATLDGARAMTKLFSSGLAKQTVLVGHSQGGHTALSALAMAGSYGDPTLPVTAVAVYSPLWFSEATWGALLFEADSYPIADLPSANAVSVWYHYTHANLLDGPDAGSALFQASKVAAIQNFVNNDCWGSWNDLIEAGTSLADLFDPAFISSVGKPAGLGSPCPKSDAVCATWAARYAADRPHLSTQVPILIEYGANDTTIDPTRMACVTDRLKSDSVAYTFCLDPSVGHQGIVRAHADYVADWIAAQTLGGTAPAACALTDKNLVDDAGAAIQCATPPPNN